LKLELLKANEVIEEQYYDFINDWKKNNEDIIPYSARLLDMDYK